jgi:hypothetical protein
MWHAWGRGEVFTGFWLGGPKVRGHWEDLGIGGRITLRWTQDGVHCKHSKEPTGSIKKAGYPLTS